MGFILLRAAVPFRLDLNSLQTAVWRILAGASKVSDINEAALPSLRPKALSDFR